MADAVNLGAADGVAEGGARSFDVDGLSVAVFRQGGRLYAMENSCAHAGGPLVEGHVADGAVTCPWHGWRFTLETGRCTVLPDQCQRTFAVREEGGYLLLDPDGTTADAGTRVDDQEN